MKKRETYRRALPRPWTPETPRERGRHIISEATPASSRRVLRIFAHWLEEERSLETSTIAEHLRVLRTFLAAVVGSETGCVRCLKRLTASDVEDFFVRYREGRGPTAQSSLQASLRLFLQLGARRGWVTERVARSVPSLHVYRLSGIPHGVSDEDLGRLLAALRPERPAAIRDRAIVFVLATYGVRREQVSTLRLSDIDWRERRITFRAHKRGKTVRHVLTPCVGEAIACYVRELRPRVDGDHIFLRAKPPHLRLGPPAISDVVQRLFREAGVESRPRGPHAFRHAFATRLLAARQPFKTIADLLGHRSLRSTAVYAKLDRPYLAEVASEWPEVLR